MSLEMYLQHELERTTTPLHDEMILEMMDKRYTVRLFPQLSSIIDHIHIASEHPIIDVTTDIPRIVGYWDVVIYEDIKDMLACILVYPEITSFRNTMRQVKTYSEFAGIEHKDIYIYTKHNKFRDAFKNDGFKFITPLR